MYYVCQIHNNLLGSMSEHETIEEAILTVKQIVSETEELTPEIEEEIAVDYSYLSEDQDWSVCIGKVG